MLKKIVSNVIACALFLFFGVAGLAQESAVKGNLGGVVVDASGAVVTGAQVTLTGATGSLTTPTDSEGNFLFVRLAPGSYSVKVEQRGFKTADVKNVQVAVGTKANVRVRLEPGEVSETVEV